MPNATTAVMCATILTVAACGGTDAPPTTVQVSDSLVTGIVVQPIKATTSTSTTYYSSSSLGLAWTAPRKSMLVRYDVRLTDQGTGIRSTVTSLTTSVTITGLKAATGYRVDVIACGTDACTDPAASTITTMPNEVWQLQGSGANVAGLTRSVPDGNVKLHVVRYGADAPSALAGRLIMYYGPFQANAKGLAAGVTTAPATTSAGSSYLAFTSLVGTSGLISPTSAAPLVRDVNTGQGVPLSAALGGRMRLFFEATDASNRTRILSLDAQDGYAGRDFNSGAATTCASTADYAGGGCAPTVVIGLEGDAANGNARIANARQFKIGYPTQSDWRWDGAVGTFMVFTTDAIPGCSTSQRNHGYAVWDGVRWVVQYASVGGCPKLLASMQAAHPVHLGGGRYKLYYGDPSDITGKVANSNLPFLGPKKLLFADAALTGDPARVDFEDWEPVSAARTITFLWPDGSTLNATARGYIDDFSIVAPTADLSLQVFYVAITDGTIAPFSAAAILVNP